MVAASDVVKIPAILLQHLHNFRASHVCIIHTIEPLVKYKVTTTYYHRNPRIGGLRQESGKRMASDPEHPYV